MPRLTAAERDAADAAAVAAARERRLQAVLAIMPAGLAPELEAQWAIVAGVMADDPPRWEPSRRYSALLHEYCVEAVNIKNLRAEVAVPQRQIVKETTAGGAVKFKINPFVELLAAALQRQGENADRLLFSPRADHAARRPSEKHDHL